MPGFGSTPTEAGPTNRSPSASNTSQVTAFGSPARVVSYCSRVCIRVGSRSPRSPPLPASSSPWVRWIQDDCTIGRVNTPASDCIIGGGSRGLLLPALRDRCTQTTRISKGNSNRPSNDLGSLVPNALHRSSPRSPTDCANIYKSRHACGHMGLGATSIA